MDSCRSIGSPSSVYNVGIKRVRRIWFQLAILAITLAIIAGLFELRSIAGKIERQSTVDEAQPADLIMVLGAAEYRGRPSPVLERRLNHALWLYHEGMAPRILTTGGKGGDPVFTEGEVARAYLSKHSVPAEAILVESEGASTVYSTTAAAEIMRRMNLKSCIVVSASAEAVEPNFSATTFMPGYFAKYSLKPFTRNFVRSRPLGPDSITTSPFPPSWSAA